MAVPAIKHLQGELYYNGFTFPGTVTTRMQMQPMMDSTGRYTKHVLYTLTVECIVWPGVDSLNPGGDEDGENDTDDDAFFPSTNETTDFGMERVRFALSQNGQRLVFTSKGFGDDFTIDTGDQQDIAYGPKAQVMRWAPVASNKSAILVWRVEVALSPCSVSGSQGASGAIAEFSYDSNYSIDINGLTTRSISGFIEIANRMSGDTTLRNVDAYRGQVRFAVPQGFQRTRQSWNTSPDGLRLSFVFEDRQMETDYAPLPGITNHSIDQRINSINFPGVSWVIAIDGTFEVAKGYSKSQAWIFFLMFVKSRVDAARNATLTDSDGNIVAAEGKVLPVSISMDDELTGRSFSANIAWRLTTSYQTFLDGSGLFQNVDTNTTWSAYQTAMTKDSNLGPWSDRGHARLEPPKKRVITLCNQYNSGTVVDTQPGLFKSGYAQVMAPDECEEHYVTFQPYVDQATDSNTVVMHSTVGVAAQNNNPGDLFTETAQYANDTVYHSRAQSNTRIIFYGVLVFVGKNEPPIPKLTSYGGVLAKDMVMVGEPTWTSKPGRVAGCKMWRCTWVIEYELLTEPTGTDFVTNPDILIPAEA